MAAKRKNPSQQEINEMYNQALEGDREALEWLRSENTLLTKAANERVRYLKKTGLIDESDNGTAAYENLKEDLQRNGTEKLIYRKGMTETELYDNITAARKFLESKTSSAKGEKKRREKILKTMNDKGYINLTTEEQKQEFLKFLDDDIMKSFYANLGELALTEGADAIANGATVEDLLKLFNDEQDNRDFLQKWDAWRESPAKKWEKSQKEAEEEKQAELPDQKQKIKKLERRARVSKSYKQRRGKRK